MFHLVTEEGLGIALNLPQDHGRDLLGRVLLPVNLHRGVRAHLPFYLQDGPIGVEDGLSLGRLSGKDVTLLGESNDRWEHLAPVGAAFGTGYDDGSVAAHDGRL